MCLSCDCGKFNDDHSDPRHITLNDVQEAARAANISLDECCSNLIKSCNEIKGQGIGKQQRAA